VAESHTSLTERIRPYLYVAVAFLTLLAINIAGVEGLYRKNLRGPIENLGELQNEALETYLADIDFLDRSELAETLKQYRIEVEKAAAPASEDSLDAGRALNKLLLWTPPSGFGRKASLVPAKSREFLMRYEDDWIKARTFLERGSIQADISIFSGLGAFKTWDLEQSSPIESLVSRGDFVLPSEVPVPETLDILTAVKVRLLRGSIDAKPLEALKEVRQFATLLLTTENSQMVMAGLATLDLERRAYREYVDRDWMDAAAWLPIDRNTSVRASRAFNATAGYLRAITDESTFNKVFASGKLPPGLCAALNEQLPAEYAYRYQLSGWWPFERSYRDGFNRLDRALELGKQHCRIRWLRKLQADGGFENVAPSAPWPLAYMPYFRTLFALRDWAAWPTRLDGYQRH
jgi:hypothetical protein